MQLTLQRSGEGRLIHNHRSAAICTFYGRICRAYKIRRSGSAAHTACLGTPNSPPAPPGRRRADWLALFFSTFVRTRLTLVQNWESTMGRLEGRTAIVTGAASGIGAASARLFSAEGANVIAVDLDQSTIIVAMAGTKAVALSCSVVDQESPDIIIGSAIKTFGGLDILFNNAGVASSHLAQNLTDDEWDRVLSVNLRAVFRLSRAAIPHLVKSKAGRIINTASVMARGTDYGLSAYCAAKAGVEGLTRTLALELGKYGVTANALLPGAIRTGMTAPIWDIREDVAAIWAKKAALRRLGEPEDLARAALFLASDDAGFVTGQSLAVDGGLTLRV